MRTPPRGPTARSSTTINAVQAWPVLAAVAADSLHVAFSRFFWASYGLNVLGFGVLAAWLALAGAGARGEARGS